MVVSEIRTEKATVRIHDDYFTNSAEDIMGRAGQIISDSYKRRVQDRGCPEMQAEEKKNKDLIVPEGSFPIDWPFADLYNGI